MLGPGFACDARGGGPIRPMSSKKKDNKTTRSAAARMYETPSRLSDAELERRGLTRATLVRDLVRMCDRTKETGAPTPASTRGADRASAELCANRGNRP